MVAYECEVTADLFREQIWPIFPFDSDNWVQFLVWHVIKSLLASIVIRLCQVVAYRKLKKQKIIITTHIKMVTDTYNYTLATTRRWNCPIVTIIVFAIVIVTIVLVTDIAFAIVIIESVLENAQWLEKDARNKPSHLVPIKPGRHSQYNPWRRTLHIPPWRQAWSWLSWSWLSWTKIHTDLKKKHETNLHILCP